MPFISTIAVNVTPTIVLVILLSVCCNHPGITKHHTTMSVSAPDCSLYSGQTEIDRQPRVEWLYIPLYLNNVHFQLLHTLHRPPKGD